MYDFGNTNAKWLSVSNIYAIVPQEVLWRHYYGNFRVGRTYSSPFRVDPTPSFSIYERGNKIMAKDHGGDFSGDVIDFVMKKHNLDCHSAQVKINEDFELGLQYVPRVIRPFTPQPAVRRQVLHEERRESTVNYEWWKRAAEPEDIEFWSASGITRDTLNLYRVFPLGLLRCNGEVCYTYQFGNPGYVYNFPSGHIKMYWPFEERHRKFRGNIDNNKDIQGYYKYIDGRWSGMTEWCNGQLLILTKSLKDVMLLHEYGIDSVAIHGEGHKFNPDFLTRHAKSRYKVIASLYDRDAAGMKGAAQLWREYGIIPLFVPKGCGKDITDMRKEKGEERTSEFVDKSIRQLIAA